MVELARQARVGNITREMVMERVFTDFSQCKDGQLNQAGRDMVFNEVFEALNDGTVGNVSDDDVKTGFMVYSSVVYCDKLEMFLFNLITNETPKGIIKTIINTIESGNLKNFVTEAMVSEFYFVLKQMFHLKYEGILLAIPSAGHLDLPYLLPYREEMDRCGNGTSCHNITQAINSLGKVWITPLCYPCRPSYPRSEPTPSPPY